MQLVQRLARLNPRPTNLSPRSDTFSALGVTNGTVSEDGTLDPVNGLALASLITSSTSGTNRFMSQTLPAVSTEISAIGGYQIPFCFSIFVKAANASASCYIGLHDNSTSTLTAYFNVSTGAVSFSGSSGGFVSINGGSGAIPLANSWFRIWASCYATLATTIFPIRFRFGNCTAAGSTTSASGENCYAYGMQLEPYAYVPGPLIPTTAFARRVRT